MKAENSFECLMAVAAKHNDADTLELLRQQDPKRFDKEVKRVSKNLKKGLRGKEPPTIWDMAEDKTEELKQQLSNARSFKR